MIKISFKVRSICGLLQFFKFKPNITLNQHLLKPIKPKKLEPKSKIKLESGEFSTNPVYIYISLENFKDPGIPEYKITIHIKLMPKLGVVCTIPDNSVTNRVLYLL